MKETANKQQEHEVKQERIKTCFVIMPISDVDGYATGHFDRVYQYIIQPACEKVGFMAMRADDTNKSNFIVLDILQQIIHSDMAICDLSARNSNVFYELGLRQAFNLKTVLIKDQRTPRSFDISGIRTIDYHESLRIDEVNKAVETLSKSLIETYNQKEQDGNSLIQLLAVENPPKLEDNHKMSLDTSILLNEMMSLRAEIQHFKFLNMDNDGAFVLNGDIVTAGDSLAAKASDNAFSEFGRVVRISGDKVYIERKPGAVIPYRVSSPMIQRLVKMPF